MVANISLNMINNIINSCHTIQCYSAQKAATASQTPSYPLPNACRHRESRVFLRGGSSTCTDQTSLCSQTPWGEDIHKGGSTGVLALSLKFGTPFTRIVLWHIVYHYMMDFHYVAWFAHGKLCTLEHCSTLLIVWHEFTWYVLSYLRI